MSRARVRCVVYGGVQGVGFRAATWHQARSLGLAGWVCNRDDGTVEILVEGEQSSVQQLVDWCHHGPPGAHVTQVEVHWEAPTGGVKPFDIRY